MESENELGMLEFRNYSIYVIFFPSSFRPGAFMPTIFIAVFLLTSLSLAKTVAPKKDETLFPSAQKDIVAILDHQIFKAYRDHNIISVRQGEIGESMAYFVRLEQPFNTPP